MKHLSPVDRSSKWPRVWGVEDPSLVDLSDEYTAIELFVDDPLQGHHHVFRYILETEHEDGWIVSEGILIGRSASPDRPRLRLWRGRFEELDVLSCIDLGVETFGRGVGPQSGNKTSGKINDDPIVFLNFDPETTTARFITSLDCVPALVRERHLGYLPEPLAAASL